VAMYVMTSCSLASKRPFTSTLLGYAKFSDSEHVANVIPDFMSDSVTHQWDLNVDQCPSQQLRHLISGCH